MKMDTWPALAAGVVLAAVASCVAATSPSKSDEDSSGWDDTMVAHSSLSSTVSSGAVSSDYAPYYTPMPFSSILDDGYTLPALTATTSVATLNRYLVSSGSSSYWSIGTPSTSAATTLSVSGTPTTVGALLSGLVEAVSESVVTGGFRLDSERHALYSVDVDQTDSDGSDGYSLVFQNTWGTAASPSNRGYVVFTYDSTTHTLRSQARYSWDPATFTRTLVSSFTQEGYYVRVNGSVVSLVASSADATALSFYPSPVNVAIPTDFNPKSTLYQPNSRVALTSTLVQSTTAEMATKVSQGLSASYLAQVAAAGDNASTEAAASAMLDQILTHSTLRYPKNVYMAFRQGLLTATLSSDTISNGTLGQQTAPYVYFTDEADASGVYHPFLCIATYSITDRPNRLVDVRRPPGDGTTASYSTQNVTRDAVLELDLVKIPLKDYGLVSAIADNTMAQTLKSDAGSGAADTVYNYASTSAVGVAVDGSVIYPVLNNTLVTTQNNAEITSIGNHVGQGMGLHYHADGHLAMNNDLQLYNINDYAGQVHPPLIGFGLDGVALYGVYESAYPSMEGISTTLDAFGGHTHGTYGYHYHAHMVAATSDTGGVSYTLDVLMKGAWKGKINSVPEFWDTTKNEPAYSMAQHHKYVGKP